MKTIYLFSKKLCDKCAYIKAVVTKLGMVDQVQEHDIETIEGLAYLAWFELCGTAETQLPILLITDKSDPAHEKIIEVVTGAINIKNKLEGR